MNKLLFALRHTPVIYWALIPTMPRYVSEFPKGEVKGNFKIDIDLQTSMGRRTYKSYSFRGNLQQAYVSAKQRLSDLINRNYLREQLKSLIEEIRKYLK